MSKEEDMQRTLCVEFNGLNIAYDAGDREFKQAWGGWTQVAGDVWFDQQDIDLSGYAMQKKTFYPYSSFEQRSGSTLAETAIVPPATTLTTQPYVLENTIVSSIPLSNNDVLLSASAITSPGFNNSIAGVSGVNTTLRFDRSVIIHGESKVYTLDSTISIGGQSDIFKLIDRQTYSSLEPTAADKLYCYRIVYLSATDGELTDVILPDSRVLMPGTLSAEPKLEYMMRLKRSYELANQV
jgi:hypothetical protein